MTVSLDQFRTRNRSGNSNSNGNGNELQARQVMVVYEDESTHASGQNHLEELSAKIPGLRCTWWRLGDFCHPGVLAGAVHTAIRADLIIVAVRSGGGMPLPFYVWAGAWMPHRRFGTGALLVLVGPNSAPEGAEDHVREYLSGVAQRTGMDFVSKEATADQPALSISAVRKSNRNGLTNQGHHRPVNRLACLKRGVLSRN